MRRAALLFACLLPRKQMALSLLLSKTMPETQNTGSLSYRTKEWHPSTLTASVRWHRTLKICRVLSRKWTHASLPQCRPKDKGFCPWLSFGTEWTGPMVGKGKHLGETLGLQRPSLGNELTERRDPALALAILSFSFSDTLLCTAWKLFKADEKSFMRRSFWSLCWRWRNQARTWNFKNKLGTTWF